MDKVFDDDDDDDRNWTVKQEKQQQFKERKKRNLLSQLGIPMVLLHLITCIIQMGEERVLNTLDPNWTQEVHRDMNDNGPLFTFTWLVTQRI